VPGGDLPPVNLALPPAPGPGPYVLSLNVPAFYILLGLLGLFGLLLGILWARHRQHRKRKQAIEGYTEAIWVDLVFVVAALLIAISFASVDPLGNRTSWAVFSTVLGGYWLTFAIPLVTVGSSIHSRTGGRIPWLFPSALAAAAMFVVIFLYTYYG
jgi:hypothetical protein